MKDKNIYYFNRLSNSEAKSLFYTGYRYLMKQNYLGGSLSYLYNKPGYFYKIKNKVVGLIVYTRSHTTDITEIEFIYVHKSFRQQNIFIKLLKRMPSDHDLFWWFHKNNKIAKKAYKKIGAEFRPDDLEYGKTYLKAYLTSETRRNLKNDV